ncbi:MAG: hypothetical protein ACREA0_31320, partial [bacterium]
TSTSLTLETPVGGMVTSNALRVTGHYADGVRRDLTSGALGTMYASSDPATVTVGSNGAVQAVDVGYAYITVANGDAREYVQVTVNGTDAPPQPVDVTARFAISKTGLRRDPASGRYMQSVTFRNTTSEPQFHPLLVIVSGLPEGVALENGRGKTRQVAPVGSRTISMKVPDASGRRPYIKPGESGTVVLEFSNRDGRPINYEIKVFQGAEL